MGINIKTLEFLNQNQDIIKNKNILMIGRQSICMTKKEYSTFNLDFPKDGYAEQMWLDLGAKSIKSIDGNSYEKPDYVHNMNFPIESKFIGKFDIIFDGGSTEHIFNCPQALMNYKMILSKGGYYIGEIPTNNYSNHGFYQFSPDFFYRFFSETNGFKTFIHMNDLKKWVHIRDILTLDVPNNSNIILSRKPTLMYVISKKNTDVTDITFPLQTIYGEYLWNNETPSKKALIKTSSLVKVIKKIIPPSIKIYIHNRMTLSKIIINTNDLNFHRNIKGK